MARLTTMSMTAGRWLRLLRQARRASWAGRLFAAETLLCLVAARLVTKLLPFRWFSPGLGAWRHETRWDEDAVHVVTADRIARAMRQLAACAAWSSNCLAQALAAQAMLRRRGIPSTLYVGIACGDALPTTHAWLRCGARIVTGSPVHARYTPVASYACEPSRRKWSG